MCYKQYTCEHFKHCEGSKYPEACANCAYANHFKTVAKWSQIGLLLAIIAYIATTCYMYL